MGYGIHPLVMSLHCSHMIRFSQSAGSPLLGSAEVPQLQKRFREQLNNTLFMMQRKYNEGFQESRMPALPPGCNKSRGLERNQDALATWRKIQVTAEVPISRLPAEVQ